MTSIRTAYKSIADLNLWFKVRGGDTLLLSDVPVIIPLRWTFFKNNWEFIKPTIISSILTSANPDFLNDQINEFSKFIEIQRLSPKRINPFADSDIANKFYAVFDTIAINSINLTIEEQKIVQSEIDRVKAFSKNNFLALRREITSYRDTMSDQFGLSDSEYNRVYSRSNAGTQVTATITDVNSLFTLEVAIKSINFILANLFAVDSAIDPFTLARTNANNPEIDIGQYSSGTLVKLNYGEDLSSLANRYLGDPNKWIDIAIANGLKAPYIDETGTLINLLSNGHDNQINLSKTDLTGKPNIEKLYLGQAVFLQSSSYIFPEQRNIISLREVPVSGEIIIELDGPRNLNIYTLADNASIRVYLPNTVNSAFFVLIPSTELPADTRQDEVPWFLSKAASDEKLTKVDFAVGEDGDLQLTANGDLRLSYGVENAIQAIKLKIVTELGALRYHPTYGLISVLGNKNNNIEDLKNTIIASLNTQIEADARFDRIETLNVQYLVNSQSNEGVAAVSINLTVRMAGGSRVIPISFTVNNL